MCVHLSSQPLYFWFCLPPWISLTYYATLTSLLQDSHGNKYQSGERLTVLRESTTSLCLFVILCVSVIFRSSTRRWETAARRAPHLYWRCRSAWTCWQLWVEQRHAALWPASLKQCWNKTKQRSTTYVTTTASLSSIVGLLAACRASVFVFRTKKQFRIQHCDQKKINKLIN